MAAEALYTYQTLLLNLQIVGSLNNVIQHSVGDCMCSCNVCSDADVEIGE